MKKSITQTDRFAARRTIVSIIFTAVSLHCYPTLAVSKCYNEGLREHADVPKCETADSIQVPDASKPTAAVFLSLLEQRNYDTILVTFNAIEQTSPLTKMNVVASHESLKDLKQLVGFCGQENANKKACAVAELLRSSKVNLIEIAKPQDYRYLQDHLQFYIKDSKVSLFPVVHPDDTTDFFDSNNKLLPKISITSQVAKSCEIPKYELSISKPMGSGKTMGGNVESLPNNIIAIGDYKPEPNDESSNLKLMSDKELKQIIKKNYAQTNISDDGINKLIASFRQGQLTSASFEKQFSGLRVINPFINLTLSEHVDETFSVVKSNSKCGFSVLIPSPKVAIDIMRQLTLPSDETKCLNSGGPNLKTTFPKDVISEKNHLEGMCVGFRGKTYVELLKDAEFLELNEKLEAFSVENIKLIQESLKKRCDNVDFIQVPYLIAKAPWGDNELVTPNLVNGLVITPFSKASSTYINNPTFFQPFDEYLVRSLKARGVRTFFVKDSDYFFGFGGYHCGSSTIQLCK